MIHINTAIFGPVSLDINTDCEGFTRRELGGAVVQAGYAAGRCGFPTLVVTKANLTETDLPGRFQMSGAELISLPSRRTCSIHNRYLTADKERRICKNLSACDPFTEADLDALDGYEADILHIAGLIYGDFPESFLCAAAHRGRLAVDAQCLLRRVDQDGAMALRDWPEKRRLLPDITFFKVDAAEAEILTGQSDRRLAARQLWDWGAGEVLLTHNSEVLVYDGQRFYTCPIKARNLSGRTGRGDTTFAGYLNARLTRGIEEALYFATALVSLKMETPGPFMGTLDDVMAYEQEFYAQPKA